MIVTDIKDGMSVFQDFALDDDVLTTIEADFSAYVNVENGKREVVHTANLIKSQDLTKYEMRLGASTLGTLFNAGDIFYIQVFEVNGVTDYNYCIHEERFRVVH